MTFPAPVIPQFPAGYGPLPADFGTWWVDNVNFLSTRVVARVAQTTTTTTLPASGVGVFIGLDTVIEDPCNGFNPVTSLWVPPFPGWFHVLGTLFTRGLPNAGDQLQLHCAGEYGIPMGKQGAGPIGHSAGIEGMAYVFLEPGGVGIGLGGALLNASTSVITSNTAGSQSHMEVAWMGFN